MDAISDEFFAHVSLVPYNQGSVTRLQIKSNAEIKDPTPLDSLVTSTLLEQMYVKIVKFNLIRNQSYIGEFEYVDDHRYGEIVVELNGRLNKSCVISPRFDVGVKEIEGWTARLLPSG
ncbi:40S ribosomal protein S15a-like [Solanum stenotomum]|uniref:40S ribosomal protein S15a-like n=1 Tax=Solanum stenotomum TaxID=172797 RepID=UPI0020D00D4D|nr:40S ribosomal protein S15a-like [Solanum stenotomum]